MPPYDATFFLFLKNVLDQSLNDNFKRGEKHLWRRITYFEIG